MHSLGVVSKRVRLEMQRRPNRYKTMPTNGQSSQESIKTCIPRATGGGVIPPRARPCAPCLVPRRRVYPLDSPIAIAVHSYDATVKEGPPSCGVNEGGKLPLDIVVRSPVKAQGSLGELRPAHGGYISDNNHATHPRRRRGRASRGGIPS